MEKDDWPEHIEKPALPDGYEWVCLRPAFGKRNPDNTHPWWVRISFRYPHKRYGTIARILKTDGFFTTANDAIAYARLVVNEHTRKRKQNDE